jgi:S-adenosylmethionine:tRNA ribosyltransferase-isomerase
MRKLRPGDALQLSERLRAEVLGRTESGERLLLRLSAVDDEHGRLEQIIEEDGSMPLPGYIRGGRAEARDREFYQTVFARERGSIAAPTAGLHFTSELLQELERKGVVLGFVTLHVGLASFQPVRDVESHQMPIERFSVPQETLRAIATAKSSGKRVIAVGTTTTRSLESWFHEAFESCGTWNETALFIRPGFEFRCVDMLITNFHQPETSHLLLVAAFFGETETSAVYRHALQGPYRFLSYGDAMLLERRKG